MEEQSENYGQRFDVKRDIRYGTIEKTTWARKQGDLGGSNREYDERRDGGVGGENGRCYLMLGNPMSGDSQ